MRVHRIILALLSALVALASTTLIWAAPATAVTTREAALLAKINNTRSAHGLRPLRLSGDLAKVARTHSRDMASSASLFHTASFSSICCWSAIAENVGTGDSVRTVHRALLRSPAHRSNILDGRMRQVGVGIVAAGGRIWVTEIFRRPS